MLKGFTNMDMVGDINSRKSTFGYLFTFLGETTSWQSKLQKYVAFSITYAEYIATITTYKKMLWMKRFF